MSLLHHCPKQRVFFHPKLVIIQTWQYDYDLNKSLKSCLLKNSKSNNTKAYLAQHELFGQIPELKDDFDIPLYCFTSDDDTTDESSESNWSHSYEEDIAINIWLGPSETVSPLHTDPKVGFLIYIQLSWCFVFLYTFGLLLLLTEFLFTYTIFINCQVI